MWTRGEAIHFFETAWPVFKKQGCYIGLTGSTLYSETGSDKDLDLIVYPGNTQMHAWKHRAREALFQLGLKPFLSEERVKAIWKRKGSSDQKHVEVWETADHLKRIDVFFLR